MLRTISTFCFIFLVTTSLFAQKAINSYKYIIVPKQYEFQKTEDQYQVNSLTKFLFEKEGFNVFFSNDSYPNDLALNACGALKAVVNDESGMLSTKVTITLVDCHNAIIYKSPIGKSKIKDFKKGYQEAIRKAFVGILELEYEYDGAISAVNTTHVKAVITAEPVKEAVAEVPIEAAIEKEVAETNKEVETAVNTVNSAALVTVTAVPVVVSKKDTEVLEPEQVAKVYAIEGTYFIDMWGECVISKKGTDYNVVGGDEDFEFAEIYTTSKPTIFMVKKTGFKQTQLLELDENGNLKIDSKSGVKIYKRVN